MTKMKYLLHNKILLQCIFLLVPLLLIVSLSGIPQAAPGLLLIAALISWSFRMISLVIPTM
jgi:hypothetical protein